MAQNDTTNRIGGVVFVKVDGVMLRVRASKCTFNPGEMKRDGVAGLDGMHGFTEKPQVPYLELEITPGQGDAYRQLQRVRNATITAEYGAGQVGILRNGWFAGEGTIDLAEGSAGARFEGMSAEQVS